MEHTAGSAVTRATSSDHPRRLDLVGASVRQHPKLSAASSSPPTAWYAWLSPWLLEVEGDIAAKKIAAAEAAVEATRAAKEAAKAAELAAEAAAKAEAEIAAAEAAAAEAEAKAEAEAEAAELAEGGKKKKKKKKKVVKVAKKKKKDVAKEASEAATEAAAPIEAAKEAAQAPKPPPLSELEKPGRHLIPLGDSTKPRIIVGHNIGYDRARIKEEYTIKQTKNFFLDTMSLHVAVNGMCSRQRPAWMKHAKNKQLREQMMNETESVVLENMLEQMQMTEEKDELWIGRSSINSLREVANFHCDVAVDKSVRDQFGTLDREGVVANLQALISYCAADVAISHKVYKATLPRFLP